MIGLGFSWHSHVVLQPKHLQIAGCIHLDLDTGRVRFADILAYRQLSASHLSSFIAGHIWPVLSTHDDYAPGLELVVVHDIEPEAAVQLCRGTQHCLWV